MGSTNAAVIHHHPNTPRPAGHPSQRGDFPRRGIESPLERGGAQRRGVFAQRENAFAARRAFTIVEVTMAVFILALALTTSLAALQRAFLQLDTARNLEIAANILQCEMEKERLLTWDVVRNATVTYVPAIDNSFARNPAIAGRFTLSRTLAVLASHSNQVLQITLTVRWRGYDGRSLARSYTSYYTQGGLYAYLYNP